MESKTIRNHRLSNREKLQQAHKLIEEVRDDEQLGPNPCSALNTALAAIEDAGMYALNEAEAHELRMAAIAEAVHETDEPALCKCGKHYEDAPCSAEFCEHCGEPQGPLGYCVYDKADGHARYESEFVHTRFTESETSSLYDRT